nr:MAG TPA: hypothetical protein [Bacteriophage sp.]
MSCNCNKNGKTVLNSILVSGVSTATSQVYALDFTHWLCGNRKICINSSYPLSGLINFNVVDIVSLGQNTWNVSIGYTGQVTYLPFVRGCNPCCDPCPKTDFIFGQFTVPVNSATAPTVTLSTTGANVVVSPANVEDCCNITNAVEIETVLTVSTGAVAAALEENPLITAKK